MKFFWGITLTIFTTFALVQSPCFGQDYYGALNNSTSQMRAVSDWTSVICFYLAVVYFGASIALSLGRNFSFGLINFAICVMAIVLMIAEPTFLNMVSMTGFKYPVKFTIQLSLTAVSAIAVVGCLFLPTIVAFAKKSKWRLGILPLNIIGVFVFPLFILSLYLVQSELSKKSNKSDQESKSNIDETSLEESGTEIADDSSEIKLEVESSE